MKHYLYAALSALALTTVATPAFAQDVATSTFSGPRAALFLGVGGDDIGDTNGPQLGVDAGYDWDLGSAVVGVTVEYQSDLNDNFLDANESALLGRVGAKMGNKALIYATGGYSRVSLGASPFAKTGGDGFLVGGGAEIGLGESGAGLKIEERYIDYGHGINLFQTLLGLNFRF